jgi:hypothetical protein
LRNARDGTVNRGEQDRGRPSIRNAQRGIHEESSAIKVRKVANLSINPMFTGRGRLQIDRALLLESSGEACFYDFRRVLVGTRSRAPNIRRDEATSLVRPNLGRLRSGCFYEQCRFGYLRLVHRRVDHETDVSDGLGPTRDIRAHHSLFVPMRNVRARPTNCNYSPLCGGMTRV